MATYNPRHWTDHLFDVRDSMVREILGRVSLCVAWAAVVTVVHQYAGDSVRWVEVPVTIHVIAGSGLAMLLVFRTNSSYERFWEARKLWGGIVNESRNLMRTTSAFLANDPAAVTSIGAATIGFAWSSLESLRGRRSLGPAVAVMAADVAAQAMAADSVPLALLRHVTGIISRARQAGAIDSIQAAVIDRNVHQLVDYLGGCERIRSTLMPYAYAVHLRRVLLVFFLTLPIALVPEFGWSTIVAVLLSSYVFFGIEEIGVEVENPFGESVNDLPLESICAVIERDVNDVMRHPSAGK